jgi:hypothetical protein
MGETRRFRDLYLIRPFKVFSFTLGEYKIARTKLFAPTEETLQEYTKLRCLHKLRRDDETSADGLYELITVDTSTKMSRFVGRPVSLFAFATF